MNPSNLCIVVPCYNEAKRISLADFEVYLSHFKQSHLCFVNDASTDETLKVLEEFQEQHSNRVFIVSLATNKGKGNAVRQGMLKALEDPQFEVFAFADADLSTSLEECTYLTTQIKEGKEFVFGSRIKKVDNSIERKWFRFIIGRIVATAISKVLDLAVYDTQCGCKVFSKKTAKIAFQHPFISPWLFDVEIFFRLKNHYGSKSFKLLSAEIPLKNWKDQGDSKIKWTYGFKMWLDLLKISKFYHT
jgi:dolichyl-phosphate beta-glucosyltransferase